MSAETLERLRAAIEAHIHDEQPGHHPLAWGLAHAYLHNLDREADNDD